MRIDTTLDLFSHDCRHESDALCLSSVTLSAGLREFLRHSIEAARSQINQNCCQSGRGVSVFSVLFHTFNDADAGAAAGDRGGNGSHGEQRRLEAGAIVYHDSVGEGCQSKEAGPQGGQPGVEISPHSAGTLVVAQPSLHLSLVWAPVPRTRVNAFELID